MLEEQVQSAITFLKTHDMEATTRFYTGVLGFHLALDQEACRIFAVRPGVFVGFCLTDGATGSPEVTLTLVVEDVDAVCVTLEQAGVEIETRPRLNPRFQIYQMFLRDPNGYLIEIQRFLDPAWNGDEGQPGAGDLGVSDPWIGDLPVEG